MAVRQQSASTTRVKRPRLQVIVSERTVAEVEALAKERGTSVSATASWILDEYFRNNPIQSQTKRDKADDDAWLKSSDLQKEKDEPDMDEVLKMFKLMKMAKESGLF